jgi:putative membrane protein
LVISKRQEAFGTDRFFDLEGDQRYPLREVVCLMCAMKSLLGIVVAFTPLSAWAVDAPAEPYPWMSQMMWGAGWYGMILMPLFMILMLAVVIAVALLIVRSLGVHWRGTAPHYPPPGRTALDILKERYARGEIDKNEFEERRRVIGE